MKRADFYRLYDMLDEIKALEKMIQLHSDDESGFMLKQYKAKKEKLTGELIDQLVTPPLMSVRSIHTIKMIIDRFYGDEMARKNDQSFNDDFGKLELALV